MAFQPFENFTCIFGDFSRQTKRYFIFNVIKIVGWDRNQGITVNEVYNYIGGVWLQAECIRMHLPNDVNGNFHLKRWGCTAATSDFHKKHFFLFFSSGQSKLSPAHAQKHTHTPISMTIWLHRLSEIQMTINFSGRCDVTGDYIKFRKIDRSKIDSRKSILIWKKSKRKITHIDFLSFRSHCSTAGLKSEIQCKQHATKSGRRTQCRFFCVECSNIIKGIYNTIIVSICLQPRSLCTNVGCIFTER